MKAQKGLGLYDHSPLTPTLDDVSGQSHALASFPRERPRTHWGNMDGTQERSKRILANIKSLALLGIELRVVQPIASRGVDVGISLS
jgi:hypothetical protein